MKGPLGNEGSLKRGPRYNGSGGACWQAARRKVIHISKAGWGQWSSVFGPQSPTEPPSHD